MDNSQHHQPVHPRAAALPVLPARAPPAAALYQADSTLLACKAATTGPPRTNRSGYSFLFFLLFLGAEFASISSSWWPLYRTGLLRRSSACHCRLCAAYSRQSACLFGSVQSPTSSSFSSPFMTGLLLALLKPHLGSRPLKPASAPQQSRPRKNQTP